MCYKKKPAGCCGLMEDKAVSAQCISLVAMGGDYRGHGGQSHCEELGES